MPYICLMQEGNPNLPRFIEKAHANNFTVIATPLNAGEIPLEVIRQPMCDRQEEFTYSDLLLTADQWNGKVISILSDTIDCDSVDPVVRRNSEEVLKRDLSWVEHLQNGGYTMIKLKPQDNYNLASVLTSKIKGIVLIHLNVFNKAIAQSTWRRDVSEDALLNTNYRDAWDAWNNFRWAADFNPKIKLVLEFNEGDRPDEDVVRRWLGEPVEAIVIPTTMFIRNRHNFPVLPKAWQEIFRHFIESPVNIIVSTDANDTSLKLYAEYLIDFREKHKDVHDFKSLEDVLEIPLQPLYDNLDCYTYEIFERDPVKYKLYQDAIAQALVDRVKDEEIEEKLQVVMVLGAGRGPLVRAAINAATITKRKIRVYIIEKNPNAIRTLKAIARKLWHNKDVHIFSKDMREVAPPEKADIIVSELLGSFGDNELSPECLDGAQNLLKPDGISIPYKSISFINPVMSSKLYNAVRQLTNSEIYPRDKLSTYSTHAESGYVVLMKNIFNIDAAKPLFEFVHPNLSEIIDNNRYGVVKFEATLDCVLTGIAGYFECLLYKDILMSINPATHTPGMFSWFPMYFPLKEPQPVKKGETIEIRFWRLGSNQKIWYEWCVSSPTLTSIHNSGGICSHIFCT